MSSKVSEFVSKLVMHFPVRFDSDERQIEWVDSMTVAFRGYDGDVLMRAAQKTIDTRTDRKFPLIAELHKICREIIYDDKITQKALPGVTSAERADPASPERARLADDLVLGEMGRQAAREGWILHLWHFVRDNGRLPEQRQIQKLKDEVRGFEEALDHARKGGWDQAQVLVKTGTSMLSRRQELAERVLHGVVK